MPRGGGAHAGSGSRLGAWSREVSRRGVAYPGRDWPLGRGPALGARSREMRRRGRGSRGTGLAPGALPRPWAWPPGRVRLGRAGPARLSSRPAPRTDFSFPRHPPMEIPAPSGPAASFLPSGLLLACGTLVAALLGAAYHLGLFHQLVHKVWSREGRRARLPLPSRAGPCELPAGPGCLRLCPPPARAPSRAPGLCHREEISDQSYFSRPASPAGPHALAGAG